MPVGQKSPDKPVGSQAYLCTYSSKSPKGMPYVTGPPVAGAGIPDGDAMASVLAQAAVDAGWGNGTTLSVPLLHLWVHQPRGTTGRKPGPDSMVFPIEVLRDAASRLPPRCARRGVLTLR